MMDITLLMLDELRERVGNYMSEKRYAHTVAVEDMASRMAKYLCPEKTNILRAAALLHDITKELTADEHIKICESLGVSYDSDNVAAKKTFHAMTAAAKIRVDYPLFADEEIIGAVRYHTTGREGMTLSEKIIYLADYIDDTRKFPECIFLREMFWGADIENMTMEERLEHLDRVVLKSLDITISDLIDGGKVINRDTVAARNYILKNLNDRG